MTEQEEREQIKTKIIEDLKYLNEKEKLIRTHLISLFADRQAIIPVEQALNTIKLNSTDYLDTGSIDTLRTFYTNFINRFSISAQSFLNSPSNKNTQNELIESAKVFNDYMITISVAKQTSSPLTQGLTKSLSNTYNKSLLELMNENQKEQNSSSVNKLLEQSARNIKLKDFEKRLTTLEQDQQPLNELQIRTDQERKEYSKKIDEIKQSIEHLQSSDAQIEIRGFLTQAKELLDKAKGSENLLNAEIQELKQAKEGHIAYNLSKELQHKSDDLKNEYEKKIGNILWKPSGFYGSISILLFVNLISWGIYFSCNLNIDFWQYIMLKLTINIPLIIYVAFTLNEYTKAKKLYEEFDYKRILAQTLMNNYNQFKTDFTDDQDKLLDLIKAPLEKIFDNPVHSIYGDKSGDKNIGLDQLEKITSIIEKMKK